MKSPRRDVKMVSMKDADPNLPTVNGGKKRSILLRKMSTKISLMKKTKSLDLRPLLRKNNRLALRMVKILKKRLLKRMPKSPLLKKVKVENPLPNRAIPRAIINKMESHPSLRLLRKENRSKVKDLLSLKTLNNLLTLKMDRNFLSLRPLKMERRKFRSLLMSKPKISQLVPKMNRNLLSLRLLKMEKRKVRSLLTSKLENSLLDPKTDKNLLSLRHLKMER